MRAAFILTAVVAIVALSSSLRNHNACQSGRTDVFGAVVGTLSPAREGPALRRIQVHCRDSTALAAASGALTRQGRDREAVTLATKAARKEPENAQAWAALALAAARVQPKLARYADGRAALLSPLDRAPAGSASPRAP